MALQEAFREKELAKAKDGFSRRDYILKNRKNYKEESLSNTMQTSVVNGRVLSGWAKKAIIVLIITGILPIITGATLQSKDPCPQNMVDERTQDYINYLQLQDSDKAQFLEQLNKKYCQWAASGKCFECDPQECKKYGIECADIHITSRTEYILENLKDETDQGIFHPGILILFGAWDANDKLVPWTKINIDIYEEGSSNPYKSTWIETADKGFAFYRWIWDEEEKDRHWVIQFSTDSGFKSASTANSYNSDDPSNRVRETDLYKEYYAYVPALFDEDGNVMGHRVPLKYWHHP